MKQVSKRWACGLLAGVLAALTLCAALVCWVDPCFYFRLPADGQSAFFSERYQSAGLVRHSAADTVILGTSMAANYRAGDVAAAFGGTALRITLPDGYLSEFDQVMDLLFRTRSPRRVLFGLDANILVRSGDGVTGSMPAYLYDDNPWNDVRYLLNRDTLYYSAYALLSDRLGARQTLEEGFTWDKDTWWSHMAALEEYQRPDAVETALAPDAYLAFAAENLAVVTAWADAHPDTEFDVFFPPYSLLFWDKIIRLGETDALFSALALACDTLLPCENVHVYAPLFDREIVENLDNYCDYIHHSGAVCRQVLGNIAAGQGEITSENVEETLANWREFVVHYDYDKFWDDAFWYQWNANHPTVTN